MNLKEQLETLALKDPDARREALLALLRASRLPFSVQEEEPGPKAPRGIQNYIINPDIRKPHLLFCAHHDAVPGSFGANDNAASICILLALAKEFEQRGIPAEFAFFDGEEQKNAGSKLYVSQMDKSLITGVVNLDLCGFGDSIAVAVRGSAKKPSIHNFCCKKMLQAYDGHLLKHLPKSDDASFAGTHIPAVSVAIVPRWDIQYLKALASYGGDGILGKPPEYEMILGQMEVTTTMHGGYRDTPEWVDAEAMQKVYDFLLDAATTPPLPLTLLERLPL